jgi:hypothetical protein
MLPTLFRLVWRKLFRCSSSESIILYIYFFIFDVGCVRVMRKLGLSVNFNFSRNMYNDRNLLLSFLPS